MQRLVLLAVLCVALTHAKPGIQKGNGLPRKLPGMMLSQLQDLFDSMQSLQDTNEVLNLPEWRDTTKTTVQNWWDSVSSRMSQATGGRTFPKEIASDMELKITEVFDQMQDEVNNGLDVDLNRGQSILADYAQTVWSKFADRVTPEQPDSNTERTRPRGDRREGQVDRTEGRRQEVPRGRRPPPMWDPQDPTEIPEQIPPLPDMPDAMKEKLTGIFNGMQDEVNAGRTLELPKWKDQAEETYQGWWDNIKQTLVEEGVEPRKGRRTFPEEVPPKMQEKIQGVFDAMQEEMDAGRDLDLPTWSDQMGEHAEAVWDKFMGMVETGHPRRDRPEQIPDKWADPVHDVFNRMQAVVDEQSTLELTPFHDEIQQIGETWWNKMSHQKGDKRPGKDKERRGKDRDTPRDMPIEMRQQITKIFQRMREETVDEQWEIDVWRNETLAVAQAWWETFTSALCKRNLEIIPRNWTAGLQEIYERIRESGNTLDIAKWREEVLNITSTWLNFDPETKKRLGFKSEEAGFLERLQERIPQNVNHIFDRIELQAADGQTINTTEWQGELEDLAADLGKKLLARKDGKDGHDRRPHSGRHHGRQDRPGRPDGRHNGRADGGHNNRTESTPNGRPNGRHEGRNGSRPDGRPNGRHEGRPNGRHEGRLNGRHEGRPNGRPDGRPNDGPEVTPDGPLNGRQEGRPDGRPNGRHEGRPDGRPYGRQEGSPNGRQEGSHNGRPDGRPYGRQEGSPNGRQEGSPNGRQEGRPNGRQEGRPNGRQEGRPNGGQEGRPNGRQEGRPNGGQGHPNGGQEGRPNGGQEGRPNGGQEGRPNGRQEGRPNGRQEGRPNGRHEGRPNGGQEGRPNGKPEGGPKGRPKDRQNGKRV